MAGLTVLYDGDCGICSALARRLEGRGIAAAPIESPAGASLLRDLTLEQRLASVHAVDRDGRRSSGGPALAAILRELPRGRPAAWLPELLPRPVELGYRLVARNRGAISRLWRAWQRRTVRRASRARPG